MKNRKGFTLVELMVVIVIIGTLAAVIIPHFSGKDHGYGNNEPVYCECCGQLVQ